MTETKLSETKTAEPVVRILWPVTGIVMALGVIYGVLWALLATGLRDVTLNWLERQQRQGWAIAHAPVQLGGFPSWPELSLNAVSVTAPAEEGGWTWQTDGITLVATIYNLSRLTIHAPNDHTFHWPTSSQDPWTITSEQMILGVALGRRGRWRGAQLTMGEAELSDPLGRPLTGVDHLDLAFGLVPQATASDDRLRGNVFAKLTGSANELRVGLNLGPFDRTLRAFRLDADLVGPIQPGRLSEALEAWRNGGGTLEVRRLLLDWPPLTIDADGTLALDDRLQPIGAFSTRITGFNETIETMESRGVIPRAQATSAQVILGLMAKTPPGGEPELSVPMSLQDQRLSVGPVNLMDLPEVRWD